MIGVVAHVRVKEGKHDDLEAVFTELANHVRAEEPGNLAYTLSRKRGSMTEYVIQELYLDQAAVAQHMAASYFREARPRLEACFAEPPVLHLLEPRVSATAL